MSGAAINHVGAPDIRIIWSRTIVLTPQAKDMYLVLGLGVGHRSPEKALAQLSGFCPPFFIATSSASAGGVRCGNDIASIGDNTYIIEKKCDEPTSIIPVGYTIDEEKKRELIVEEWIYGPWNDYYYILTMVAGACPRFAQSEDKKGKLFNPDR